MEIITKLQGRGQHFQNISDQCLRSLDSSTPSQFSAVPIMLCYEHVLKPAYVRQIIHAHDEFSDAGVTGLVASISHRFKERLRGAHQRLETGI